MSWPCPHKVASAQANIYIDDILDSFKGTHACICNECICHYLHIYYSHKFIREYKFFFSGWERSRCWIEPNCTFWGESSWRQWRASSQPRCVSAGAVIWLLQDANLLFHYCWLLRLHNGTPHLLPCLAASAHGFMLWMLDFSVASHVFTWFFTWHLKLQYSMRLPECPYS